MTLNYSFRGLKFKKGHGERASENNDYIKYVNITWSKIPHGRHQTSWPIPNMADFQGHHQLQIKTGLELMTPGFQLLGPNIRPSCLCPRHQP